jgi:hypothetical protein
MTQSRDPDQNASYQPNPEGTLQLTVPIAAIVMNTEQTLIVVTEDKARLCLGGHMQIMQQNHDWVAPAGILATLIAVFASASFRDFIVSKDVWEAIFIISAAACVCWLGLAWRRSRYTPTVDDVIRDLKRLQATTKA